jgi:hypothetical protein
MTSQGQIVVQEMLHQQDIYDQFENDVPVSREFGIRLNLRLGYGRPLYAESNQYRRRDEKSPEVDDHRSSSSKRGRPH